MSAVLPASHSARERALRTLCADVLRTPGRMVQASFIPFEGVYPVPRHAHRDLLQMDLVLGCEGGCTCDGRELALQEVSALVFYPGQEHSYALRARRPGTAFFSFKIRVTPACPVVRRRLFPGLVPGLAGEEPLVRAMRRVARLASVEGVRPPLAAVAMAEVFCLWPGALSCAPLETEARAAEADPRLESALSRIEESLANPPSLDELARDIHVSPRHLARRFRALCGCTPRAFLTARRIARAKDLLAQGELNVSQAAEALGFPGIHAFSRWFRREAGVAPAAFRQRPGLL